jgi:hypothetical protein
MNIVIDVSGEARSHRLELRIENYRRGRPAITSGPADNWEPAEGDEFDVTSAWLIHGNRYRLLPWRLREKIVEKNEEKIVAALDK